MVLGQPLAQARRQQQLPIAITRDEVMRHPGIVLTAADRLAFDSAKRTKMRPADSRGIVCARDIRRDDRDAAPVDRPRRVDHRGPRQVRPSRRLPRGLLRPLRSGFKSRGPAVPFRPTEQRTDARSGAPRQLLSREAEVSLCAPAGRPEQARLRPTLGRSHSGHCERGARSSPVPMDGGRTSALLVAPETCFRISGDVRSHRSSRAQEG
jgi:hypothetical protein